MFRVEWLQSALAQLANIWTNADSTQRAAVTAAANVLETRLVADAANEGESRPNGRRITFAPPLTATFRIEADGTTVTIINVRMFRQGKR